MKILNQETELVPVGNLRVHPENPNVGDVEGIAESIAENGFFGTILAQRSTGYVLAGNHTFQAALKAEAAEVPVTWVDVDDVRAKKILLADNNLARRGRWDESLLDSLLETMDGDMEGTGFTDDELEALGFVEVPPETPPGGENDPPAATGGEGDPEPKDEKPKKEPEERGDPVAKAHEKWQAKTGEVYLVGGVHKVMCGDSTRAEDVAILFSGEKPAALVTDPPFAITGSATGTDDMSGLEIIEPFFRLWMGIWFKLLPLFAHIYSYCDFRTYGLIVTVANESEGSLKNCIIWDKGGGGLGSYYQNTHEFVYFGVKNERRRITANKTGARLIHGQPNIWRYNPPTYGSESWHTANKPVDMVKRMIENSTDEGDLVAEPFGGGGTTLIAAHRSGRRCFAMELKPKYVSVALERADEEGLEIELIREAQNGESNESD